MNANHSERIAQQSHVAAAQRNASVNARDAFYLSVNHDRSRGESAAEALARVGLVYKGRHGHVSID